jgi:hypothetical protein
VTLQAFTAEEAERVERLLALKVAHMMGRKLEEGDWSEVYCAAKDIPNRGWSNLNVDVMHNNLGVEHKMLRYSSGPLSDACGRTLMHPSATRSFRIESLDADPNDVMRSVLAQYAELLAARKGRIIEQDATGLPVDLRTGWLLWEDSLSEFLYFEEETVAPDPDDYFAEWVERKGGSRKGSKNLWVFERATGLKRYSVTTSAGGKIQPYFDVPPIEDPNLWIFRIRGMADEGVVRAYITTRTARVLEDLIGGLDREAVDEAILTTAAAMAADGTVSEEAAADEVVAVHVSANAYEELRSALGGINDEHAFQLLADYLASRRPS